MRVCTVVASLSQVQLGVVMFLKAQEGKNPSREDQVLPLQKTLVAYAPTVYVLVTLSVVAERGSWKTQVSSCP